MTEQTEGQAPETVPGTDGIPRRIRVDLAVPAEVHIRRAFEYVECLGADERLTKASTLLGQALARVADFIESLPADDERRRPARETEFGEPLRIPIEPKYEIDLDGIVYNRQSGRAIPEDEPVILFRAQDARLPATLAGYLAASTDPDHRQAVALRLAEVAQWQAENPLRVKEPDTLVDENWRGLERPNAGQV